MQRWLVIVLSFILAGPARAEPQPMQLLLTEADLTYDAGEVRFRLSSAVKTPVPGPGTPVIDPLDRSPEARILRQLVARRQAAGLAGVYYDNRDRGHSPLPPGQFPQLVRIAYAADLIAGNLDLGLPEGILFPGLVLGNSSTAVTLGPAPRSLPRLAMTWKDSAARAWQTYASNHLYIFPEHRDHDAMDLYPANWPYMLTSQGSSYTDQPFMRAFGLIVAALRPETQAFLRDRGLMAPTVQMVFRRAQTGIRTRADYLSGKAHPSVFEAQSIAPVAMVKLANTLLPQDIPPLVRLDMISEDFSAEAGLARQSEELFTTPSAIARIVRSYDYTHTMTISAAATKDPNGRPLSFSWVLLRGDPARVRIEPLDAAGRTARIEVDWQEPRQIGARDPRLSARVDIGIFADNGRHDSAPAMVSVSFANMQTRLYETGPGGGRRIKAIDYRGPGPWPVDPALHWLAPWRDDFGYDAGGLMSGWTRQEGGKTLVFNAAGRHQGRRVTYVARDGRLAAAIGPLLGN